MSARLAGKNHQPNRLSKSPAPLAPASSPTPFADPFKGNTAPTTSTSTIDLSPTRVAASPQPPSQKSYSSTSTPNTRSTTPTLTSPLASPVKQQRHSYLSKPPPSSPQSTKMSNYSSQQSYGSGGPPPRPSRANTSNLNDIVSSSHPSSRRLSSPQSTADQYTLPSLDPGDSPPPSAINGGNTVGRSRSSTQGKNKKGMLSFMSDFLTTAKRPEISTPYDPVHLTHVGFNSSTGEFTGLPKEWQQILQENGISRQDQEKNPQAVVEIFKFYQETAGAPGKIADKYMATSPTSNGSYELGEGFQNPRAAPPPPPVVRKASSNVPAPSGPTSTPQPYRPAPSAPVPSAAAVTLDRSASTRSPVPPGQPTRQPSGSKTDGGLSRSHTHKDRSGTSQGDHQRERTNSAGAAAAPVKKPTLGLDAQPAAASTSSLPLNRKDSERGEERGGQSKDKPKQPPTASPRPDQGAALAKAPSTTRHAPQPPRAPQPQSPAAQSLAKHAGAGQATPRRREKPKQDEGDIVK
ncbi:signal transducing kinase of the PAK, partial [Tulasnella sp. 408]